MFYIDIKNINETRSNFPSIFSEALNSKLFICKNGKTQNEQTVSIISTEVLEEILNKYSFSPIYRYDEETSLYEIRLDEIGQFSYAETREKAEEELLDLVLQHVDHYMTKTDLFRRMEGYKEQYPYILKIAYCKDQDSIKELIFNKR